MSTEKNFWNVLDKYNQEVIQKVELLNADQVESALKKSLQSFSENRKTSAEERSEWLEKIHQKLSQEKERFVDLIIKEAGKPRSYAVAELDRSLATIKWGASEALRFSGEVVPFDYGKGKGKKAITGRYPVGVILGISPFNFPLNLALHKIVPALATGNAIVIKPSHYTPLALLAFEELVNECGVPEGLFQVICCDPDLSNELVKEERIKMLSFTGSPKIGWMLKERAGKKKVLLELGGNAAVYVDKSSLTGEKEAQKIAKEICQGAYLYSGQICISTQRIFVHQDVRSLLEKALIKEIATLKSGDPSDSEVIVGPLIADEHLERISSWVEEAVSEGAEILCGGKILEAKANLYEATLLTKTKRGMKIVDEEAFAPVALIESVNSIEEGIEKINDSRFGLQAGVYTQNIDHMKLAHDELEVGGVIMNGVPGFRLDPMPYGGVKDSGLGREGLLYSMREMTEERLLVF
ncbi:MAG: aldehyde dehydrogenase family protein [Bdellovibrionota bacterium]|nr:aldehyde dehydrogenase family protein [Bdellovibrionota bacterium]